jgi:hypothetical protein
VAQTPSASQLHEIAPKSHNIQPTVRSRVRLPHPRPQRKIATNCDRKTCPVIVESCLFGFLHDCQLDLGRTFPKCLKFQAKCLLWRFPEGSHKHHRKDLQTLYLASYSQRELQSCDKNDYRHLAGVPTVQHLLIRDKIIQNFSYGFFENCQLSSAYMGSIMYIFQHF